MKLYFTGVSGLLGGNLSYLLRERADLSGCDRNETAIPGLLLNVFDCLEGDRLRQDLETIRPDAVIHCAGFTSVDGCERDPDRAYQVNTVLSGSLARICRDLGAKLVFLSSDAVYNGDAKGLHREDEETAACNVYGKSKILAEERILQAGGNPEPLILRTNFLGFNIRRRTGSFEWMLESMRSGKPVTLFEDVFFSPLSIPFLTEVIWEGIRRDLGGVYNASCAGSVSKLEFGHLVKQQFGLSQAVILPGKVADAPLAARRSLNMGMDSSSLSHELQMKMDSPSDTVRSLYEQVCSGYPQILRGFDVSG